MRLIAIGEPELLDGFHLLGFEIQASNDPADLETLCCALMNSKQRALVFFSQHLGIQPGRCYRYLRQESGEVILIALPPLNAPEQHTLDVDALITRVLGPHALDMSHE